MTRGSRVAGIAIIFALAVLAFVLPSNIGRVGAEDAAAFDFKTASLSSAQTVRGDYVYLGGIPIGISISADGLIVQGQSAVFTESGEEFPAADSGILTGDIIVAVNGEKVKTLYALKLALEGASGEVTLTVSRLGRTTDVKITPATDISGQKRLGLVLKEDIGGVGTLTFVTPEGRYGALGHYILDADTGLSAELTRGKIYPTSVEGVVKGEVGKAGGLRADVNRLFKPLGTIDGNLLIGIFGDYFAQPNGELIRVAAEGEAKMGRAQVLATIEGDTPTLYDIDVVKVSAQKEEDEKGMVIVVRDKRLLEKTGGIVQGMSGSPIIQNGALIGAVTHVFVQDPTRGYAVHSRFMYDAAVGESEQEREAA